MARCGWQRIRSGCRSSGSTGIRGLGEVLFFTGWLVLNVTLAIPDRYFRLGELERGRKGEGVIKPLSTSLQHHVAIDKRL